MHCTRTVDSSHNAQKQTEPFLISLGLFPTLEHPGKFGMGSIISIHVMLTSNEARTNHTLTYTLYTPSPILQLSIMPKDSLSQQSGLDVPEMNQWVINTTPVPRAYTVEILISHSRASKAQNKSIELEESVMIACVWLPEQDYRLCASEEQGAHQQVVCTLWNSSFHTHTISHVFPLGVYIENLELKQMRFHCT